ncbi:STAS domain-containing protein [Aneurinibacillus migulanus]|uniref:STAS domain-containing protein n=1 Tax=Aneurinibacillus migulanus TaxID=47500 RepID=UPI002E21AF4B|nr:STAS domain-containing protein [Aneurinibacillus migulanus]
MEQVLYEMSQKIIKKKDEIAEKITYEQNLNHPEQLSSLSDNLLPLRSELVTLYGRALAMQKGERIEHIAKWGKETGTKCAKLGATLDAMLNEVPHYRYFIGEIVKEEAKTKQLSLDEFYHVISILDSTVNQVVYYFTLPFLCQYDTSQKQSRMALMEISVPVVPIAEGLAVLPLVGNIDTYRAQILMEQALQHASRLQLSYFIFDLSGVPVIDTAVAQQLFHIVQALKLIGVDTKISGIRPEIAQTIIALGIDLSYVMTFSDLRQALKYIGFTYTKKV